MKIFNITNACTRVELEDAVLLCDPWMSEGIFNGGWSPYPPIKDKVGPLKDISHCFISHIHEDHCDYNVIAQLDRNTVMLVPDIYPNHTIQRRLSTLGFSNIRMLPPSTPIEIGNKITVEAVPPMNSWGLEVERYKIDGMGAVAADAGLILKEANTKLVLLSDNSPYNLEDAGPSLTRLKNADLLAFPYNGFADDFPICYDNFSDAEKSSISLQRCESRARLLSKAFEYLKPKAVMPYSSDFSVCGPRALDFAKLQPQEWASKEIVAEYYQQTTGIPAFALYEDDVCTLTSDGFELSRSGLDFPTLGEVAQNQSSIKLNEHPMLSINELEDYVVPAAQNMFNGMKKLNIASEWCLCLDIIDLDEKFYIDFKNRLVDSKLIENRKTVTCYLDSGLLKSHLDFEVHWNNTMISYALAWSRKPNEYDASIYKALNFFHCPL